MVMFSSYLSGSSLQGSKVTRHLRVASLSKDLAYIGPDLEDLIYEAIGAVEELEESVDPDYGRVSFEDPYVALWLLAGAPASSVVSRLYSSSTFSSFDIEWLGYMEEPTDDGGNTASHSCMMGLVGDLEGHAMFDGERVVVGHDSNRETFSTATGGSSTTTSLQDTEEWAEEHLFRLVWDPGTPVARLYRNCAQIAEHTTDIPPGPLYLVLEAATEAFSGSLTSDWRPVNVAWARVVG